MQEQASFTPALLVKPAGQRGTYDFTSNVLDGRTKTPTEEASVARIYNQGLVLYYLLCNIHGLQMYLLISLP